jgi:hypothetical protein
MDAEGRLLPAGPPPPQSWRKPFRYTPAMNAAKRTGTGRIRGSVDRLPGLSHRPADSSLVATCLRHMARNWGSQCDYNRDYLATLPTSVRTILLSYIAAHGPEEGVGYGGVRAILRPGEEMLDEFSGNNDFERLDITGAIGRSIFFRQLQELLTPLHNDEEDEESWDTQPHTIPKSINAPLRSLKFLSLADPSETISWAKFINFVASIPTVTHLSLANWPTPSLTPNSLTATMTSRYLKNVQYGGTNYYSHTIDQDWSEAASLLRRLSNALYSLEWLDLDGCDDWFPALRWGTPETPGIDWKERWGKVRNLKLHSGVAVPVKDVSRQQVMRYKTAILNAMEVEKIIRRARGWINVEIDEWTRYDESKVFGGLEKTALESEFLNAKAGRDTGMSFVSTHTLRSLRNGGSSWE